MILAHKIALNPTRRQAEALLRAAGTARYTYNWALEQWTVDYAAGGKPNAMALKNRWNKEKPEWVKESPRDANATAFADLRTAFTNFFRRVKAGGNGPKGYPRFRRRGVKDGFGLANDKFRFDGKAVRLPVIGWIRCREALRLGGKILSGRVKLEAGRWYLSVQVQFPHGAGGREPAATRRPAIGVDLGLTTLATLSTGEKIEGPRPLAKARKKLRRAQRAHSRKKKGSNRRKRSAARIGRLHRRVRNVRQDFLHKLTTRLTGKNHVVVLEDLNVKGMMSRKGLKLGQAVADASFGELRRQIEYKAPLYGTKLVFADRFFPSSKACSNCGEVNPGVVLGVKRWACPGCGEPHDRDLNAAKNLERLAGGSPER